MPLISFDQALEETEDSGRVILLGNGFSMAQTQGEFGYRNLLERSNLTAGGSIRNTFTAFDTVDFEVVIHALEHASVVEGAYGDGDKQRQFLEDAQTIREALIHAVRVVHPTIQFDVPIAQYRTCGDFLKQFEQVFTLNYDLLMYWTNLNTQNRRHRDGFGIGEEVNGFREFSETAHCSIYHLHGALHLFRSPTGETLKRVSTGQTILEDIANTILGGQLPIFVAEGTSDKKLQKINSVPYLKHALDCLKSSAVPVFIFGHSADDNDRHIYNAIFNSEAPAVYFCAFGSAAAITEIERKLARYTVGPTAKPIHYVDANEMNIWGI